jgi:hypothetical protein
MTDKTISDLSQEFVVPLPADLMVGAHSLTLGAGKVAGSALGGGGGGPPLATTTPANLAATASVGVSTSAARADHVHQRPSASQTTLTAAGGISATNVQSALYELDTEKVAVSLLGQPNGVAQLDDGSLIANANLPSTPAAKTDVTAIGSIPAGNLQVTLADLDTRISALSQSLTLAGTYNALTDAVDAIAGQGMIDGPLPAPGAHNNKYVIINTSGTGIGNAAGLGTLDQGNWLYSNGTAWNELVVSTGTTAASNVSFNPAGTIAASNVQAALVELDTEKVSTTRTVTGTNSLTGGGALSSNQTLQLVGDAAAPGNSKVYGTTAAGVKGWKDDPAGGSIVKPRFNILGTSLPLVTPAARTYISGVAGNGVQYPAYEFSGSADNLADFFGAVPSTYANGSLTVKIFYTAAVISGTIGWSAAFCHLTGSLALDATFTFTYQSVNVSPPGTIGVSAQISLPFTQAQANNIAAGNPFVLRFRRLAADTNTGVANLLFWSLQIVED